MDLFTKMMAIMYVKRIIDVTALKMNFKTKARKLKSSAACIEELKQTRISFMSTILFVLIFFGDNSKDHQLIILNQ